MIRLVSIVHGYPPHHNAGAENYVHQLNRWLTGRGHDVQVLQRDPIAGGQWEGVRTIRRGPPRWVDRTVRGRVILTHLDETGVAQAAAERTGSPIVHVLHNHLQLERNAVRLVDLIVANTDWIAETVDDRWADVPRLVLYPPTFCADYPTDPSERVAVTLVNLTPEKGAGLFYDLAARQPDRLFYGVTGAYGAQVPAPPLPNIRIIRNRPNLAPVWDETRVYVQPSSYESYGKAAVEALAGGIPVVAHPTEGLVESLGPAGVFADRSDVDAWIEALQTLDDPETYALASKAARARAEELETVTVAQLEAVEAFLEDLTP